MTVQCIFPAEIVGEILCYTTPLDVVRWRTVSKWFCVITHDPRNWKTLHANAPFLRPPFSRVGFERTFVKSARLAQTWTTQELRTMSRVTVSFDGWVTKDHYLVGGRWLVVCQSDRRFVLYDTDPNAETYEHRVIWEHAEDIITWSKYIASSEDGQCIVYVLVRTKDSPRLTLLELRLDAESGALRDFVTLDVPVSDVHDVALNSGQELFARSRFLSISNQSLIFDTCTRIFCEFPEFRIALDTVLAWCSDKKFLWRSSCPTNTHVIVLHAFFEWFTVYTVVQAFTISDDERHARVENGRDVLRLTHEGVFSGDKLVFAVIRNSVVDPVIGAITTKLLERDRKWDNFKSICITLTLEPESSESSNDVSRIFIDRDPILIKGNIPINDDLHFCNTYYDISDDGYARGLLTRDHHCTNNTIFGIVKFTIDATQDECVAILSEFSHAGEWNNIVYPVDHFLYSPNASMVLDGVRGRLSYINENSDYVENATIVVVDFE